MNVKKIFSHYVFNVFPTSTVFNELTLEAVDVTLNDVRSPTGLVSVRPSCLLLVEVVCNKQEEILPQ